MFNNKFKKSGSGAALLAAAPTLALQAQGGVEAAAVNSPQALNIVGDSFKGSGNSASKVIKVLPWVGAVGLVLFLAYWAYCVKNNSDLSKKYESEIEEKARTAKTYEQDLKNYSVELGNLERDLNKVKDDIDEKTQENKEITEEIKKLNEEGKVYEQKLEEANKKMREKEEYIKANAVCIDELKQIALDAEELGKGITYFRYKALYDKEMSEIRAFLTQVSEENTNLVSKDLLEKKDEELLNLLTEDLIKKIEKFAKEKMDGLVDSAFEKLKKTYPGVVFSKDDVRNYLTSLGGDYGIFAGILKLEDDNVKAVELYKAKGDIYTKWQYFIGQNIINNAKAHNDEIKATNIIPGAVDAEKLLEKIKDLTSRVEKKIVDKVLQNVDVRLDGVKKTLLSRLKYGIAKKEDFSGTVEFCRSYFALKTVESEVDKVLKREYTTKTEKENLDRYSKENEENIEKINDNNKLFEENKKVIKGLDERKKRLEKLVEEKKEAKSGIENKIAYINYLTEHKKELDKNFWKPYPYSYENNAQ